MPSPKPRLLSADEEKTATIEQLVLAHKPLVQKMARNFTRYGMEFEDLVQEGDVALMIAAQRFDREMGFRFSTYAHWWIRAQMQDAVIRNFSLVGQPMSSEGKKRFFRNGRPRDVSVNTPISDEGMTVGDLLVCPAPLPEEVVGDALESQRTAKLIRKAMRQLEMRERDIITSRLLKEPKDSLDVLGQRLGISKERVRQIEARALGKLEEAMKALADESQISRQEEQ